VIISHAAVCSIAQNLYMLTPLTTDNATAYAFHLYMLKTAPTPVFQHA